MDCILPIQWLVSKTNATSILLQLINNTRCLIVYPERNSIAKLSTPKYIVLTVFRQIDLLFTRGIAFFPPPIGSEPSIMSFRIAAVSFLNSIPLIEWFNTNAGSGHQVFFELPSSMSNLLANGDADVALLPVVEAFRGRSGGVLAGTGIACHGNVASVKLFSRGPLSQVRKVFADRGSRSSVALVQVLLGELEAIKPELVQIEPRPGDFPGNNEAILVIGDRCFEYEKHLLDSGRTDVVANDLGGLWYELTGLSFVFAVWALAPGFMGRWGEKEVKNLSELLAEARDFGLANLETLAVREAANGRMGYLGQSSPEAIYQYFQKSLIYKLGDRELMGLEKFHELCVKHGLVTSHDMPCIL